MASSSESLRDFHPDVDAAALISLPNEMLFQKSSTSLYEEDVDNTRKSPELPSVQASIQQSSPPPRLTNHPQLEWKKIQDNIVLAPFKYVESLPAKGVRNTLIDALNVWLRVPERSLDIIKTVVGLLHTSSLMYDDIEDNSALRRGKPTAHRVFGVGQTTNSSTYVLISAIIKVQELPNNKCVSIVTEEVSNMLLGQSIDLHTTYLTECPTEAEYLDIVDNKTGALFRMAYRLMLLESEVPSLPDLEPLLLLLGRYFQIRDDYINLLSDEYMVQKGFCEDLDEGKFSFPLIHCLISSSGTTPSGLAPMLELRNIFMTRNRSGGQSLSHEMKLHVLEILNRAGSLAYSRQVLERLDSDLEAEIATVERATGSENPSLRALAKKLRL